MYRADNAVADSVRLAKQQDALLWVDDLALLQLAEQNGWARCTNWQVLAQAGISNGQLSTHDHAEILATAAGARYSFIHVSSGSLSAAVELDQPFVSDWRVRALLQTFRDNVELRSTLGCFISFLRAERALPSWRMSRYVYVGLSALTLDGRRYVDPTLGVLDGLGGWAQVNTRAWTRGHFIDWPAGSAASKATPRKSSRK